MRKLCIPVYIVLLGVLFLREIYRRGIPSATDALRADLLWMAHYHRRLRAKP